MAGAPYWDGIKFRDITKQEKPKLREILYNLDELTHGAKTYIFTVQVKHDEAVKIEKYWKYEIYKASKDNKTGVPDLKKMPPYHFSGGPGTYNCTTCVSNSLRKGGADIYDVPILGKGEEMTHISKIRPNDFADILLGNATTFAKARSLKSTCGPQKGEKAGLLVRENGKWSGSSKTRRK